MTPEEFVRHLRSVLVDEPVGSYRMLLESSQPEAALAYWVTLQRLYRRLSPEEQDAMLLFCRQVMADTTSHVLGILDGSSYLPGRPLFSLRSDDGQRLDGDLQDLFLEAEETDPDRGRRS